MSKFSIDVLQKCVHPYIKTDDPDVVLGSAFGEDVALTRIENGILVSHLDPIVGAVKDIGWLAVHVACNDIATSGANPRWIQLLVLVPRKEDEDLLKGIMQDVNRAAKEIGVSVIGGHSGYSANLSRPLVAVTALGVLIDQDPICTKGAYVGDHVFVTKGIALEGTAILANDFVKTARKLGLNERDLVEARELMKGVSIIPEALILAQNGATSMHDVTRGGLIETLVEVAKLSDVRIQLDSNRVPQVPVVARFAKAFQFEPLKMLSSGTLVATIPPGQVEAAAKSLESHQIPFADVGLIVEGNGVNLVENEKETLFQNIHCEEDELARMWEIYPHDNA